MARPLPGHAGHLDRTHREWSIRKSRGPRHPGRLRAGGEGGDCGVGTEVASWGGIRGSPADLMFRAGDARIGPHHASDVPAPGPGRAWARPRRPHTLRAPFALRAVSSFPVTPVPCPRPPPGKRRSTASSSASMPGSRPWPAKCAWTRRNGRRWCRRCASVSGRQRPQLRHSRGWARLSSTGPLDGQPWTSSGNDGAGCPERRYPWSWSSPSLHPGRPMPGSRAGQRGGRWSAPWPPWGETGERWYRSGLPGIIEQRSSLSWDGESTEYETSSTVGSKTCGRPWPGRGSPPRA